MIRSSSVVALPRTAQCTIRFMGKQTDAETTNRATCNNKLIKTRAAINMICRKKKEGTNTSTNEEPKE